MSSSVKENLSAQTPGQRPRSASQNFWQGAVQMLPLCLSVIPWGILAGSMAINSGLTLAQSVGMSAIIYAGAAQLVTLGMLATGASAVTIIVSVIFITAQHLLYGLTFRKRISPMPLRRRLLLGFLLTDELFALGSSKEQGSFAYFFGAGLCFYIAWVLFSLMGILLANAIPNLAQYHLDFSIIATFMTIVIPMIRDRAYLLGILFSLLASMTLTYFHIEGAIVISGVLGMFLSVTVARCTKAKQPDTELPPVDVQSTQGEQ